MKPTLEFRWEERDTVLSHPPGPIITMRRAFLQQLWRKTGAPRSFGEWRDVPNLPNGVAV